MMSLWEATDESLQLNKISWILRWQNTQTINFAFVIVYVEAPNEGTLNFEWQRVRLQWVKERKEGRSSEVDACSSRLFPSPTVMGSWLLKITREEGGRTHGEEIDNQDTRTRTWLWRLGRYIRALYYHHVLIKWAGHYSSGEYCQAKSRNRKVRNINSHHWFMIITTWDFAIFIYCSSGEASDAMQEWWLVPSAELIVIRESFFRRANRDFISHLSAPQHLFFAITVY